MTSLATIDVTSFVRVQSDGARRLELMVAGIHCASCVRKIERAFEADGQVDAARVNLSTRRMTLGWHDGSVEPGDLVERLAGLGYRAVPYDPESLASGNQKEEKRLLRSLAVAGFAAANVMLLSVAIWAGEAQDMGASTQALFHWVAGLIALPAVAYAGRPFFGSALAALRAGQLNMDVPISLAVILAAAMSLWETATGGNHVYFDAAVTLLFFLLCGRYLDLRARAKACAAAEQLIALRATAAEVIDPDGTRRTVATDQVRPGMTVAVAPGERLPVDGRVAKGQSDVDTSLVTGESVPVAVAPGTQVFAGTINLTGAMELEVTREADETLLSDIVRLMEAAEQGRARYVRIADRVARIYAPVVHILALATFAGWVLLSPTDWQTALLYAVAVLIITCPCALGLAVPVVQVVASGRLFRRGTLLKSGDALERLAEVDTVVLDKTGTLTEGAPQLINQESNDPEALAIAGALASQSRHPLSVALARAASSTSAAQLSEVREHPGAGLEAQIDSRRVRLGSRLWCGMQASDSDGETEIWLAVEGRAPERFVFSDRLRADAADVVAGLQRSGLQVVLLSGDRPQAVERAAVAAGIDDWQGGATPADKVGVLGQLAAEGHRVLMVGDGLNDAPALAAAHVSLSPATAADISQTAADAVFQGNRLAPVLEALDVARRSGRLVRQNLGLAFLYNAVAIPFAVAGLVTPLFAAIAMSASSIAVTVNSLRLGRTP
jgi:P-type Cu2+ transporter